MGSDVLRSMGEGSSVLPTIFLSSVRSVFPI